MPEQKLNIPDLSTMVDPAEIPDLTALDLKKKDNSQVLSKASGEDLQASSQLESPSQSPDDKVWEARRGALEGKEGVVSDASKSALKSNQQSVMQGDITPSAYYEQQVKGLTDTLNKLGIQKIQNNIEQGKQPIEIPSPINPLAAQHLDLSQPISDPLSTVSIGDVQKIVDKTADGELFFNEDISTLSQTTDLDKEREILDRKYFPGRYEAPEASFKNYLIGYNKTVREAIGAVMNDLNNAALTVGEITGLESGGGFGKASEYMEGTALTKTKLPETAAGAIIKGGVDLTVFLAEMEAVPVKGAGKLFAYLGTKGFVDAFGEEVKEGGDSPYSEGLMSGFMGLKDAAVLHTLGYTAGYAGSKVANKPFAVRMAQDQNSWLRKYVDKVYKTDKSKSPLLFEDMEQSVLQARGQQGIANVVTGLSNGALYSGYVTGSDYLRTGEVDIDKSIADMVIGTALPFTSVLGAAKNRAYAHFIKAPAQVTAFARGVKMEPDMARVKVDEIREMAAKEGDFGKAESMRIFANTLEAVADVKTVSEKVANKPSEYLSLLKGSGATPEEAAMYREAVYKAVAAHKVPTEVIPDFIKSMNARDEVTQMKKDMTDAKSQGRVVIGYEERIMEIENEIKMLDGKIQSAADKNIMTSLNEKIIKGEPLSETEWLYKDRIDPDGEKSVGIQVEGVDATTGKLDVDKNGYVVKDELLGEKKVTTVEDVQALKDKTDLELTKVQEQRIKDKAAAAKEDYTPFKEGLQLTEEIDLLNSTIEFLDALPKEIKEPVKIASEDKNMLGSRVTRLLGEDSGVVNSTEDVARIRKQAVKVKEKITKELEGRTETPDGKIAYGGKVYDNVEQLKEDLMKSKDPSALPLSDSFDVMKVQDEIIKAKDKEYQRTLDVLKDRKKRLSKAEELLQPKGDVKDAENSIKKDEVEQTTTQGEIVENKPSYEATVEAKTENEVNKTGSEQIKETSSPIDRNLKAIKENTLEKEDFKKKHAKNIVDVLREQLVDKTEPSKIRILKQDQSLMKQYGKRVINMLNLEAGSGGNALLTFKGTMNKIFGSPFNILSGDGEYMSEKFAEFAWDYASAKRDIETFDIKGGERILKKGLSIEDRKAFVDAVEGTNKEYYNELKDKIGATDNDMARMKDAAEALRGTFREGLDRLLEENMISQNLYDKLVIEQPWYSPIKYLEFVDRVDKGGKLSGLKRLEMGSEQARVDDMTTILGDYSQRIEYAVAKNKTYKAMAEYAKVNPDNTLFKQAELSPEYAKAIEKEKAKLPEDREFIKPIFKDTPKDFTDVDYIDGSMKRLWVDKSFYHQVQRQNAPDKIQQSMKYLGWVSGKKVLTAAATGYDPGFALKNPMLDFQYNFLTQNTFGSILPEAAIRYLSKVGGAVKDAFNKSGTYKDMMKMGGSQQFLSGQGRYEVDWKYGRISKASAVTDIIENAASLPGQISEVATRSAIYQTYIEGRVNKLREMGIEPDGKIMKVLQEEATAASRAYLDFSQGGYLTKRMDEVLPYFNAASQVTRGALRAAAKNPADFGIKIAQLASIQAAITTWNMSGHKDLDEETVQGMSNAYLNDVSPKLKEKYYIIMLPYTSVDKDGNNRFPFVKIPKDNTVSIIASTFEDMVLAGQYGIESTDKNRFSEFRNLMSGFMDVSQLPPTLNAIVGSAQNRNLYFQEDLWKGADVGKYRSEEWTYGITPEKYQLFSEIGLSPTRAQYSIQQVLTDQNAFGTILGYGIDKVAFALKGDDRKAYEKTKWEQIKSSPMAGRFIGLSSPKVKSEASTLIQTSLNAIRQSNNNILAEIVSQEKKKYNVEKPLLNMGKDGKLEQDNKQTQEYLQSVIDRVMSDDFILVSKDRNANKGINDVIAFQEQQRILDNFLTKELALKGVVNVRNFNKYVWMEPAARGWMLFNDYSQLDTEEDKNAFEQDMFNYSVVVPEFMSNKVFETYSLLKSGFKLPSQQNSTKQ